MKTHSKSLPFFTCSSWFQIIGSIIVLLALSNCSNVQKATNPTDDVQQKRASDALKDGIDLYSAGDYNGSLEILSNSLEIWSVQPSDSNGAAIKSIQLDAYKYMAFNYCVTHRPTICKEEFEKALKLDPSFDLVPGEKGHPLWGPVFERAKKESAANKPLR